MRNTTQPAIGYLIDAHGIDRAQLNVAHDGIYDMQTICHHLARSAGWWDNTSADAINGAVKIALIHSEVSEALEGLRKGKNDDHLSHRKAVEVELADAMIRIMDLAGAMGLDLAGAIVEKLAYNQNRADHKMENRNADGGKKF